MNCEGIKALLSEGRPLTESAEQHLAICKGCSTMLRELARSKAEPAKEAIRQIQKLLGSRLTAVRPLASDWVLTWQFLGIFVTFSILAAIPFGYYGFRALNRYQRVGYLAVILVNAGGLALILTREMIPGSRRKASGWRVIIAALVSLVFLAALLFHNFDLEEFVGRGLPCLGLGSLCAIVSAGLFGVVFRSGFFTSPMEAGASMGVFAGLAGVAVLALHCPIQNSAHVIIWHLGAMLLGGSIGGVLGSLRR